jgi:hypothetical protein
MTRPFNYLSDIRYKAIGRLGLTNKEDLDRRGCRLFEGRNAVRFATGDTEVSFRISSIPVEAEVATS